jgi:hypothetical protein
MDITAIEKSNFGIAGQVEMPNALNHLNMMETLHALEVSSI